MEVFFYGLFMDISILSKNGISPSNPRRGFVEDYTLKIGNRASLIPRAGERAHGIIMTVSDAEIHGLYDEASVADYIPEEVNVITDDVQSVKAVCYNLPEDSLTGTNEAYARSLLELGELLGLPPDYLKQIKEIVNGRV